MTGSLTTLVVLVTLLHVAAIGTCIWIRVRKDGSERPVDTSATVPAAPVCVDCGAVAHGLSYDGLDPNEGTDPHTGRKYSIDATHYQPRCAVCAATAVQAA